MASNRLQNKLEFMILFEVAPREVQDVIIAYAREIFEKQTDIHYELCVVLAKQHEHITSEMLLRKLNTYYAEVRRIIQKLQENKVIDTHISSNYQTKACYYRSLVKENPDKKQEKKRKKRLSHITDH